MVVLPFKFKNVSTNLTKIRKMEEIIPFLVLSPINRNHHLHTENQYGNNPRSKYKFYRLIEKCELYNLNGLGYCQDVII